MVTEGSACTGCITSCKSSSWGTNDSQRMGSVASTFWFSLTPPASPDMVVISRSRSDCKSISIILHKFRHFRRHSLAFAKMSWPTAKQPKRYCLISIVQVVKSPSGCGTVLTNSIALFSTSPKNLIASTNSLGSISVTCSQARWRIRNGTPSELHIFESVLILFLRQPVYLWWFTSFKIGFLRHIWRLSNFV